MRLAVFIGAVCVLMHAAVGRSGSSIGAPPTTMKSDCVIDQARRPVLVSCSMWPALYLPVVLPLTLSAPIDNLMEIGTKIELQRPLGSRQGRRRTDHCRRCDVYRDESSRARPVHRGLLY